ncbi:MAG TPA: ATP-binding protein [Burkholderiales bacterium]|jgi:two-component system sensor histidine kinase RegB
MDLPRLLGPAPLSEHLQRLLWLRGVLLAVLAVALPLAALSYGIALPWGWMLVVAASTTALTLHAALRLRQQSPVTERGLFLQLLVDVGALSALLYLSGGPSNPFVSLYLLPLVIAATTLPQRYTWALTALTVGCYAALFLLPAPAPHHAGHGERQFDLHLSGMWVNFVLSAVIICIFVVRMAEAIRRRDALLAAQKEEALRNERIVALGTLAAGAAHELGTPLSTMAVLLREMAEELRDDARHAGDIETLRRQVDACKDTITRLSAAAGQPRAEGGAAQPLDRFLLETVDKWRMIRPAASLTARLDGARPAPAIVGEQTLQHAIVNLLNNAADASPDRVELDCDWDAQRLHLEIRDRGQGLTPEARERAGRTLFTTKPGGAGSGIGLLLARATLERLGGRLNLRDRAGGGVITSLELPLHALAPSDASR